MSIKTSELFVKALEAQGIKYVFGVPGEENLDLLDAFQTSSIQFVTTRHEQGAGFMAATFGRLTGIAGVALSTLGPGSTNLVTPAAYAQLGGMPALFITGQKPIKKSKQGQFQIVNTVELMRPITKYAKQLVHGQEAGAQVREAVRIAEEERPGAVHLELPEDIAAEMVDDLPVGHSNPRRPVAEEKAIAQAVTAIDAAQRPLILIGAGANRKRVSKMLRQFIDKTGIPFFTTQMGKGVIDERHPLNLGTAALTQGDYLHKAVENADLILNVGHDIVEKPPFVMKHGGATVIHINFFSARIDQIYFPQLEVIGDIANTVWQLSEKISKQFQWDASEMLKQRAVLDKYLITVADDHRFPYAPQRIVADIRGVLGDEDILTLDNGMYKLWFARNYFCHAPNTLLLDNALATMGAGLPSAMAAKLLYPDKKVMTVCGDGGFLMNSQELETVKRLKLDLVIVVLRDNGYGMIKWKQQSAGFADFGLDFDNPDFVKLAESYGITGHRVTAADQFPTLLTDAFAAGGLQLIEVPIDYADNAKILLPAA